MVTAKEVPPGGVGEVKATFRTKGFQGRVRKSVTVETNDPDRPRVRLAITGKVVTEVMVTPRYVNFRTVKRDALPRPTRLEIRLRKGAAARLLGVTADNPAVILREVERAEDRAVYEVALSDKVPVGRLTGRIHVKTTSKKMPEVQVPCYAFVEGYVKVSPQVLSFGLIRPGEPVSRELLLRGTGKAGFSVEKVETSTERMRTEVLSGEGGEPYRVRVTYDPGDRTKGKVSEKLRIFVKGREEEVIEIPVHGTIHAGVRRQAP